MTGVNGCHMECHCSRVGWRQKTVRMKRNLAGQVRGRTQWINVLTAKPEGVSSSHKTHIVAERMNSFNLSSGPWVNQSSLAWERTLP